MIGGTANDLGGFPASFGRRLVAAIIDGLAVSAVVEIVRLALGHRTHGVVIWQAGGNLVGLLFSLAYFTYFHGKTGQTPGDAALGIRIVDLRDAPGKPIGYQRALLRWAISIVSAFALLLGYLWMLWDSRKQTWHDRASGSVPIYVSR